MACKTIVAGGYTMSYNNGFSLVTDQYGNGKPSFNVGNEEGIKALKLWVKLDGNPDSYEAYYDPTEGKRKEEKGWITKISRRCSK